MDQFLQQVGRTMARLDVPAVVDILILVFLIYGLLSILRGTRAEVLLRGLIILFGVAFIVVNIWPLTVLKWVVTNAIQFVIVASVVVFAPEIRRALEQIGHTGDFINRPRTNRSNDSLRLMIDEVVAASFYLSSQRWGGLIVLERETGLQDLANKGVLINGQVSSQLLVNIFVPNTPLHDGAVIIRHDQVIAAKVILPLSDNLSKYEQYGTRHKAALGMSEQSDAPIVVVSEETGHISIAFNGELRTKLDREQLRKNLQSLLEPYPNRFAALNLRNRNNNNGGHKTEDEEPTKEPVGRGDKL
jgi:diadenylate cyclase